MGMNMWNTCFLSPGIDFNLMEIERIIETKEEIAEYQEVVII